MTKIISSSWLTWSEKYHPDTLLALKLTQTLTLNQDLWASKERKTVSSSCGNIRILLKFPNIRGYYQSSLHGISCKNKKWKIDFYWKDYHAKIRKDWFLLSKYAKFVSISGPLHMLWFLSRMLFLGLIKWVDSFNWALCATSSEVPLSQSTQYSFFCSDVL